MLVRAQAIDGLAGFLYGGKIIETDVPDSPLAQAFKDEPEGHCTTIDGITYRLLERIDDEPDNI